MNISPLGPAPDALAIDLSAGLGATSAAAWLRWRDGHWRLETPECSLDDDATIVREIEAAELVALDGPRAPPPGFERFVERGEKPPLGSARSRACEREHTRRICPIFYSSPVATLGMQRWMTRSWGLFEACEHRAHEIYPMGGFVATLNGTDRRQRHGLPPKGSQAGQQARLRLLQAVLGAQVHAFAARRQGNERAHDRIDAVMAVISVVAHHLGRSVELGEPEEGTLVVPDLRRAPLG